MTQPGTPETSSTLGSHAAATRPARRAAAACGLAAALTLTGAATATAAPTSGRPQPHASSHHGDRAHPASSHHAGQASSERQSARSSQRTSQQRSPQRPSQQEAPQHQPKRAHAQDPRGNNGTIKIDGPAYDTGVDNEPHPGCEFRVTFFGFDAGQTADITITGIAPTGGGPLLHDTAVPTSTDAAGGAAHDPDGATRTYTATDLGLTGLTPHPKQGYHLKVTVDSLEAPGGAKQKVLWLAPCEAAPTPATLASQVAQPGLAAGAPGAPALTGAQPPAVPAAAAPVVLAAESSSQTASASTGAARPAAESAPAADATTQVEGVTVEAAAARTAGQQASALPAKTVAALTGLTTLAFTGASGVLTLLLGGLATALAGVALRVLGRRPSTARR
jgi:hypothetical protein